MSVRALACGLNILANRQAAVGRLYATLGEEALFLLSADLNDRFSVSQ